MTRTQTDRRQHQRRHGTTVTRAQHQIEASPAGTFVRLYWASTQDAGEMTFRHLAMALRALATFRPGVLARVVVEVV